MPVIRVYICSTKIRLEALKRCTVGDAIASAELRAECRTPCSLAVRSPDSAVGGSGGVELARGPIVDEVLDLADGGIYTPVRARGVPSPRWRELRPEQSQGGQPAGLAPGDNGSRV